MNHIVPILKEMLSPSTLKRTPEPMIMSDFNQTMEFFKYGQGDTTLKASYLFHARQASRTIKNCKRVLDLGAGPANQLSIVAKFNPNIQFYGIEMSENMISLAQKNCKNLGLTNVHFIHDDITKLSKIEDKSFDGVISSVALHHLNTEEELVSTFESLQRVLVSNSAVYITDFLLVKNSKSIDYLLSLNADQPDIFKIDYENSLNAAFEERCFKELKDRFLPQAKMYRTTGAKFLMILKSKSFRPEKEVENKIKLEVSNLGKESRSIYRSLSALFMLDGLF